MPRSLRSKSRKPFLQLMTRMDNPLLAIIIDVSLDKDSELCAQRVERHSLHENIKKLTPREYEIMTYVITRLMNKQIAFELNISEETVKIHRGSVMQKLEIVSVAELVRLCGKAGIAPAEPNK